MLSFLSSVGSRHEPARAAAAACRNWLVVRGSSTSARAVRPAARFRRRPGPRARPRGFDPGGKGVEERSRHTGRQFAQLDEGPLGGRQGRIAIGPIADRELPIERRLSGRVFSRKRPASLGFRQRPSISTFCIVTLVAPGIVRLAGIARPPIGLEQPSRKGKTSVRELAARVWENLTGTVVRSNNATDDFVGLGHCPCRGVAPSEYHDLPASLPSNVQLA